VDMVHLVPTKEWSKAPVSRATLRSVLELRKKLREEHYDLVVDMQGTLRSAFVGRFAGAKEFAGYSDPRESLAEHLYKRKLTRSGEHVVEQGAALLGEACGVALRPGAVELPHAQWADEWAAELVESQPVGSQWVCVLAAGAGWGAKRWPVEKFGTLARALQPMGFTVLTNQPRKDDPVAAAVVQASEGAAQVVGCNVTGLVALLRRTALLIGGDSGPTHVAAALGVPLVALYGPTSPARNGPWGAWPGAGPMRVLRDPSSLTSHKKIAETEPGLAKIPVDAVLDAVREVVAPMSENPDMGHPFSR